MYASAACVCHVCVYVCTKEPFGLALSYAARTCPKCQASESAPFFFHTFLRFMCAKWAYKNPCMAASASALAVCYVCSSTFLWILKFPKSSSSGCGSNQSVQHLASSSYAAVVAANSVVYLAEDAKATHICMPGHVSTLTNTLPPPVWHVTLPTWLVIWYA